MKLWSSKKTKLCVCVLTPIVLSPLATSPYKETRCAFILLWMAIYWMLEPVHLAVTALMPVPLMPILGILSSSEVCADYMKEVLMMFLGGLAVAVAVEHCKLHERIALRVLMFLGSDTKWLMLGFMLTTMFLSMWISNTATTAMMVPIVDAVMSELKNSLNMESSLSSDKGYATKPDVLHTALLLSIAYSANCGGTGTVTGTSPNMILKGLLEELHPKSSEITFASWMAYNVPGMIICVFAGWTILQLLYVPCWRKQSKKTEKKIASVIASRYKELGTITFHEAAVFCLFTILVFLWIFREPKFVTGWADLLSSNTRIGDAVPAIAILFLMFLIPAEPWRPHESPPLLQWSAVQMKLPWGLVIILGGGFALAHGTQESGLSKWLGEQMNELSFLSPAVVLVILCGLTAGLTEVISNSTVATILLPVISQMAVTFGVHPLYLMLPVAVTCSYAFMLPVATGPNVIVFESGHMKTSDMVKPGILMNIVCCGVQMIMINTLGNAIFNLGTFPDWANNSYITLKQLNRTSNNSVLSYSNNSVM